MKALSAGCCTNLNLAVSEGAGIKADLAPADATVAAKGLIAKSILPAAEGGTVLAAADVPEGDEPTFSAVICTVPSTQADLSTTLKAAKIQLIAVALAKYMHFFNFCLIVGFVTLGIGHMPFRLQVFNGSLFVFLVLSLAQLQGRADADVRQGVGDDG